MHVVQLFGWEVFRLSSDIENAIPKLTQQDRDRIRKLVYNQPDVMVDIFEALTNLLISKAVIEPNEIEVVLIAGIQNWRGGREPIAPLPESELEPEVDQHE